MKKITWARLIEKILPNAVRVEIFSITAGLILSMLFSEFSFVHKNRNKNKGSN